MSIFILRGDVLATAREVPIERESNLEDWLENSPWALIESEDIFWIGRQTSAKDEEGTFFPDLLGIDAEGNLIIVELKREQAPREVIAQLFEYAAWASELSDAQIHEIAEDYFNTRDEKQEQSFHDAFKTVFDMPETDEIPPLNRRLRLFIVAEEIPSRVERVCRFFRTLHSVDISCIAVSTFQTESNERIVSMETKVGDEDAAASKNQRQFTSRTPRWSGDKPVKQVVLEAVQEFTNRNADVEFSIKDIERIISEKHPDFNRHYNGLINSRLITPRSEV